MEVHSLVDHSVARTTLQPPGAHCQICSRGGGRLAKPPHPYKHLGLLAGALPHRQHPFYLSTKS
jgi:hypothetical protein